MKYVIDEIIENIAVLEKLDSNEKEEVNLSLLPPNIKEKNILIKKNNSYKLLKEEELKRKKLLRNKLERLKKYND